jgi:hypothetical protein
LHSQIDQNADHLRDVVHPLVDDPFHDLIW